MIHIHLAKADKVELRPSGHQVLEVMLGEKVSLTPAVSIAQIDGEPAAVAPSTITPAKLGSSRYRLTQFDGTQMDLRLLCFEPECLTFVGNSIKSHGFGGEPDSEARRRRILRSVATDRSTSFDGTVATLCQVSLQPFGA
jgi:hypothetical protein